LALNNRVSLSGSYRELLWTPLPSPAFSLLTGQWLDFHQLADYHASRTTPSQPKVLVFQMVNLFYLRSLVNAGNRPLLSTRNYLTLGFPMPRKHNHSVAWLLGISFILLGIPSFAEPSAIEEVLGVLGMDKGQIAQLAQGQPVVYALSEGRTDELAIGVVWYLPVPLAKVAGHLRLEYPDSLEFFK
jgi:hypothetical protein